MSNAAFGLSRLTGNSPALFPKILYAFLISAMLLAGIGPIGGSFIPFDVLHAKARAVSATGQIPFFTFDFYREIQVRLRLIGALNVALFVILALMHAPVLRTIERVLADCRTLGRDIQSAVRLLPAVDLVVVPLLVVFAILIRTPLLSQPMRYDEAYTFLQYSSHPFYVALSFYNAPNNHLLNTLLVRAAYLTFGNQPWALRLPAFLAGVCLAPSTYVASRSLYRPAGALFAAGLVASSSVLIEYSSNARGYGMVCLAFMLLIPLAAYALRYRNWAAWFLFGIVAGIGFYAVPIMLYPFGGVILWLILSALAGQPQPPFRDSIIPIFVSACVTMLLTFELYSPALAVSGPSSLVANKWVTANRLPTFLHGLPLSFASTWRDWNRSVPLWLSFILASGFFTALILSRRCSRFRIPLVVTLIFWILPLVFIQRVIPFERVWLFALPLYFLTAAAGIATVLEFLLPRRHLYAVMTLIALAVSAFIGFRVTSTHSAYLANDCRGLDAIVKFLKPQLKPGDSVAVVLPSDIPLYYYFQKEGLPASFINAPTSGRRLVVVNEAAGDTVSRVLAATKLPGDAATARLLTKDDLASVYEILPQKP